MMGEFNAMDGGKTHGEAMGTLEGVTDLDFDSELNGSLQIGYMMSSFEFGIRSYGFLISQRSEEYLLNDVPKIFAFTRFSAHRSLFPQYFLTGLESIEKLSSKKS